MLDQHVINCVFTFFGCQVFYLDNMAFGDLSPEHDLFPRVSAFTDERMSALLAADTKINPMSNLDLYGITRVIHFVVCVPPMCFASYR